VAKASALADDRALRLKPGAIVMQVRCAVFEGTVDPADRPAFDAYIDGTVLPILASFPKIRSARVLRAESVEDDGPPIYQMFELQFDSAADLANALASPNRARSRAALAEVMPRFKGRIFHVNYRLTERTGTR
jgi:uncharacterized protein (TIGR02118 family)